MNKKRHEVFSPEHLEIFELRDIEKAHMSDENAMNVITLAFHPRSLAYTFFVNDLPVAIYGVTLTRPNVYCIWAFPSIHIDKHAILYLKEAKKFIKQITNSLNADRIETTTYDDPKHNKWLTFLGFECESGPLRKYSMGQSFRSWAIINGF